MVAVEIKTVFRITSVSNALHQFACVLNIRLGTIKVAVLTQGSMQSCRDHRL